MCPHVSEKQQQEHLHVKTNANHIIKIMANMDGRRNYSSSELLETKASDSIFNKKKINLMTLAPN